MDFRRLLDAWENSEEGAKLTADFEKEVAKRDAPLEQGASITPSMLKKMKPQAELDLHGCTATEATTLIMHFLHTSARDGLKKVQIIHGKGIHSENREPVLQEVVRRCIEQSPHAGASGIPSKTEGGSGAIWVAIKSNQQNSR